MDYVLCASPRTGSNLLKSGLHHTGVGGSPEEAFDASRLLSRGFPGAPPIDVKAYLDVARGQITSPNGVFGLKLHFHHAEQFFLAQGLELQSTFDQPRFVNVVRDDRLAQAISWQKAMQTGQYTADQPARSPAVPSYDFVALAATFLEVMREQLGWERYFRERRIEPLTLRYENLVADYESTIRRTLDFLDVSSVGLEIPPPRVKKQSDATNDAWRQRFLDDLRAGLEGQRAAGSPEATQAVLRLSVWVTLLLVEQSRQGVGAHQVADLAARLEAAPPPPLSASQLDADLHLLRHA